MEFKFGAKRKLHTKLAVTLISSKLLLNPQKTVVLLWSRSRENYGNQLIINLTTELKTSTAIGQYLNFEVIISILLFELAINSQLEAP